jgi:hypothetical protein
LPKPKPPPVAAGCGAHDFYLKENMKSQEMTFGYDLGKGSIGEVVRLKKPGQKPGQKSLIAGIVFMQCGKNETGGLCVNFLKSNSMAQARPDSR